MISTVEEYVKWLTVNRAAIAAYHTKGEAPVLGATDRLSSLSQRYIQAVDLQPYSHQVDAAHAIADNHDVVITTPTASGKTTAFELAICETLSKSPDARVLTLYPAKAVAHDQLLRYKRFTSVLQQLGMTDVTVAIKDNDATQQDRDDAKTARLLVSNPHSLHCWLAGTKSWPSFIDNLQLVVLDEAHTYSGVQGTHVSLVLRRLLRLVALRGGSPPRIVAASATIANPVEHCADLFNRSLDSFVHISKSGAPKGEKYIVILDNTKDKAIKLQSLAKAVDAGLNSIAFTRTRQGAELLSKELKDEYRVDVPAYRAGYSPSERRNLEARLRAGELKGIISTSALELGIDIGALDVVNILEIPPTTAGLHQQLGRAGRTQRPSVGIIQLDDRHISRYYAANPRALLSGSMEKVTANITNQPVLTAHVRCAGYEAPITAGDAAWFGSSPLKLAIEQLQHDGDVVYSGGKYVTQSSTNPAMSISLLGKSREMWQIVTQDGELLETTDVSYIGSELYQGAAWTRQHTRYRVIKHDRDNHLVVVAPAPFYWSKPLVYTVVTLKQERGRTDKAQSLIRTGTGTIDRTLSGYKCGNFSTKERSTKRFDEPIRSTIFTDVTSIDLKSTRTKVETASLATLLVNLAPLIVPAVPGDIATACTASSIDLADTAPGGSGVVATISNELPHLLKIAKDLLTNCSCVDGCTQCVIDSHSSGHGEYSKKAALSLTNICLNTR